MQPPYGLRIKRRAEKYIQDLPQNRRRQIEDFLHRVVVDPHLRNAENLDLRRLQGVLKGQLGLVVSDYRVEFEVKHEDRFVIVYRIGPRGDAYRK